MAQEIAVANKTLAIANKIVTSRYRLTNIECRLVFHLIGLIDKDDDDFAEYKYTMKELLQAVGMTSNNVAQLEHTMKSVFDKSLHIETEEGWIMYHWFDVAEYNEKEKSYRIRFNDELKPYLLQLRKHYTLLDFQCIMKMSIHSRRIYMIAKKDEFKHTNIKIAIDELKKILELSDKYPRFQSLKERVLNPAEKEVNELSDITLDITPDESTRKGRAYQDLIFTTKLKPQQKQIGAKSHEAAKPKPQKTAEEIKQKYREQRIKVSAKMDEVLNKRWAALPPKERADYMVTAEATANGLEGMGYPRGDVELLAIAELAKYLVNTNDKEYSALAARFDALGPYC